jgi:hypothetical protein
MWVGLRTMLKNVDEGKELWTPAFWKEEAEASNQSQQGHSQQEGAYDMRDSIKVEDINTDI